MGASVLLPLLLAAATNLQRDGAAQPSLLSGAWMRSHGLNDDSLRSMFPLFTTDWLKRGKEQGEGKQEARKEWRSKVAEWKARNDKELEKWAKDGPQFEGSGEGGDEEGERWQSLVQQWREEPAGEREEWQDQAWQLLHTWLEDDSPGSVMWGGLGKQDGGVIHLTSRFTTNNQTEERVAVLPSSSLLPLVKHMVTSPMFAHYAPMLLPILIPVFLIMFLGPFLLVPLLISLVVVPLIVMTVSSLAMAGSALLPFGLRAGGHLLSWLARQDLERMAEKSGTEDIASVAEVLSSTLSPPEVTATNTVLHSEVPRMISW